MSNLTKKDNIIQYLNEELEKNKINIEKIKLTRLAKINLNYNQDEQNIKINQDLKSDIQNLQN